MITKYYIHNIGDIYGRQVRVYFNLHKKTWSIMDKKTRRVIGHSDFVPLKDCKFIVSEAGRQRVLREKRKNVHAYVEGTIGGDCLHKSELFHGRFTYNPYKYDSFVNSDTEKPMTGADYAYLVCDNKRPKQTYMNRI